MTTIHMETEKTQALASKLDANGSQMLSNLGQMRSAASRLHFAWQGGGSDDFHNDLNRLIKNLENQAVALQTLSVRVLREVDEWLTADQFGTKTGKLSFSKDIAGNTPSGWSALFKNSQYLLMGGGFAVMDGIHALFGVARDQFNRQIALGRSAVQRAVQASDGFFDDGLTDLLGTPQSGRSESINLKVKGDVTIPGVVVGAPTSFKGEGAKEVTITRENGKYKLVFSNGGGVGIEEPLLPGAEGQLKVGKNAYGAKLGGSAEALAKGEVEVAYEFDPKKPGDLTKMAALMYGVGVLESTASPLVAPTLFALKDNLVGIKIGAGGEVGAEVDASALVKVAGIKSEVGVLNGGEMRRVDGKWEAVQQSEIKLEGQASFLTGKSGGEVKARYETIAHPDGSQSVKVIVDAKSEAGSALELKNLQKMVPSMKSLEGSNEQFESVKIEYTVDAPLETVKKMFESPKDGINWQTLNDNSSVVIHETTGSEVVYGGSGKLQLPTQKIGVGGEVGVRRESSSEIYRSR